MTEKNIQSARQAARMLLSAIKLAVDPNRGRATFLNDAMLKAVDAKFNNRAAMAAVEAAEAGDPLATEAVHQAIAWYVREGEPLPESLRAYLIELLLLKPPIRKQKKGRQHDNYLRDSLIRMAVLAAVTDYGLNRTRNESVDEPSACSLVAEVLAENGVNMGEANVERITRPNQKRFLGQHC